MIWRSLLILAALTAAYFVGNSTTSLWDRDEPRYAQASRQMMDSRDWVVPKYLDDPRLKKPPLIYWCQAAAMKWFGASAWSARLPSVLATVLTLALITAAVAQTKSTRAALWTAFIYGTAALTIAAAKMAITDAVLTLFILAAQLCLYRIYVGRGGWGTAAALGISIGLAGLTKGPVVVGALVTTALVLAALRLFDRVRPPALAPLNFVAPLPVSDATPPRGLFTRELQPLRLIGKLLLILVVALLIIGPWWHAVDVRYPGMLWQTIWQEVFVRAGKPQEGHSGPPGFYLVAVWATFFPWSLLLPAALVEAWKLRSEPPVRFALAAAIGPWIMFELVATKLPHYILPTYAPLAYLVARVLIRSADGDTREFNQPHWPNVVAVWAVLVALIGFAPWLAAYFFHPLPWQTYVAFAILSLWAVFYGAKVHGEFDRRYPIAAAMWMGLGMIGNVYVLYTGVFPVSQYMRLSERVANGVRAQQIPAGEHPIMIDFKEPSLAFYQGGTIRQEDRSDYLQRVDPTLWPTCIVLTEDVWKTTPPTLRDRLDIVAKEEGWNYADGGRRMTVLVLRKKPL